MDEGTEAKKKHATPKKITEFHQKPDLLLRALSITRSLPSSMAKWKKVPALLLRCKRTFNLSSQPF